METFSGYNPQMGEFLSLLDLTEVHLHFPVFQAHQGVFSFAFLKYHFWYWALPFELKNLLSFHGRACFFGDLLQTRTCQPSFIWVIF